MSPHRDSSVKFGWSLRAIAHFCLCKRKSSSGNSSHRSRSSRLDSGRPASASTRRLRRLATKGYGRQWRRWCEIAASSAGEAVVREMTSPFTKWPYHLDREAIVCRARPGDA